MVYFQIGRPDVILVYIAFTFMKIVSLALTKLLLICTRVHHPTGGLRSLRGKEREGAQRQTRMSPQASELELETM